MMIRDASGTSRTITGVYVRDANNVSRQVSGIMIRDGSNTSRSVLSGGGQSSVSVDTDYVAGYGYSKGTIVVTTQTATVTAPQGSTYAWTIADSSWRITAPTSPSCAFSASVGPNGDKQSVATCTVTTSGKTATVTVNTEVQNNYGGLS